MSRRPGSKRLGGERDSVAFGGAFGELLGELGMPVAGLLGHRALSCHALFDRPAVIITVIGFHRRLQPQYVIPHVENVPNFLSDG